MEAFRDAHEHEVTRAVVRLGGRALAVAVRDVSDGSVLLPMAMYQLEKGPPKLARFRGATMSDALAAARDHLTRLQVRRSALLFDGYLPGADGKRSPALYLQLMDQSWSEPDIVALKYRIKTDRRRFAVLGDPVLVRPSKHPLEMEVLLDGAAEEPDAMAVWAAHRVSR